MTTAGMRKFKFDIRARARSFAKGKASATATVIAMRAMESDPISVRITFTD
jgi:hypothetical protein